MCFPIRKKCILNVLIESSNSTSSVTCVSWYCDPELMDAREFPHE